MKSDILGEKLVDRLRQHVEQIDWEVLHEFVNVSPGTTQRWLRKRGGPPNGERLNRLWHFLALSGIDSPELERLTPYHRFLSELLAFGVIKLSPVADGSISLLEILAVKKENDAFRTIRGDQTPMDPLVGTVEELEEEFGDKLRGAKEVWKDKLAQASVIQELPPAAVSPPQPPPSTQLAEPVEKPVEIASATSNTNNSAQLLELARGLASVIPLVHYALSEQCSDEDRALMRQLLGPENLFLLVTGLSRLSSTRAFNEGRK